jgi:hypothetical protein
MNLLDQLEEALPVKKDVTPPGWPIATKVFTWKITDESLIGVLNGSPTNEPDGDEKTRKWIAWMNKILCMSLSSEEQPGDFDNPRGKAFIERLSLTIKNHLFESVRNFLEIDGQPSEDRKKE